MNLNLRKVESSKDIDFFVKNKILLVKAHQSYANAIGLIDKTVANYNGSEAKKYLGENNFFQGIIEFENKDVGIIEYSIKLSDIDDENILYINKLFVASEYRGKGIGKEVLLKIRNETNYRIELECWYGMPANKLYKSLGMQEVKTRYTWKK